MKYRDLRDFLAQLETRGDLTRVSAAVDPRLELTEVCASVTRRRSLVPCRRSDARYSRDR